MSKTYYYRPKHPKADANGFVERSDLGEYEEEKAVNAPVMVGRFYENQGTADGVDIGSRRRHQEYMKRNGLAMASEYTNSWKDAERTREKIRTGEIDRKERREAVGRAMYGHWK